MKGSAVLTVLNADTGKDGQFTFSGLALGEYRLSAQKIEAGYLSTGTDVLGGGKPLAIALTAEMPTSTALIHLGPKAAIITGWVLDSSTGSAISAKLSLRPMDGSSWSMTGIDQKFRVSGPSASQHRHQAWRVRRRIQPMVLCRPVHANPSHPRATCVGCGVGHCDQVGASEGQGGNVMRGWHILRLPHQVLRNPHFTSKRPMPGLTCGVLALPGRCWRHSGFILTRSDSSSSEAL